ncbi:MAG: sulfite exporter TauE/SafE family protein [Vicinamibacterales bacterium]
MPADSVSLNLVTLAGAAIAAAAGSMINAIAGGGTLLTFPSLIALGITPLSANATNAVSMSIGTLGSAWGYRNRMAGLGRWAVLFTIPSALGAALGALLLLWTPPDRFDAIVPWLVLGATALFAAQGPLLRLFRRPGTEAAPGHTDIVPAHSTAALISQFAVGIYGGYFGAAMGIMMLTVLGFLGFRDIHQMNGVKTVASTCINFVASCLFLASGIVDWPVALVMAIGGTLGGYLASRLAQRVSQVAVRRAILAIGVISGLWLFR